MPILTIFSRPY